METRNVRILLFVDDSEVDVNLCELAASRSQMQYDIRHVHDAQCAMQWLMGTGMYQRRNVFPIPDAVVVDLRMRGTDGLELLYWIRKHPQFQDLPVIVHTHSQSDDDAVLSRVRGVTQYIIKDVECRGLMDYLETLFKQDAANRGAW